MKILHIIYTQGISGAEKYLKHLLPGLGKYGYECHLVIISNEGAFSTLREFSKTISATGIPVTVIKAGNRLSFISAAKFISAYLTKEGIQILHSHLINSDIIACLVKTLFKKKLTMLSTKHGYKEEDLQAFSLAKAAGKTLRRKNDFYAVMSRFTLRTIPHNFAVSASVAEFYSAFGLSPRRMPFIHNGINVTVPVSKEENGLFRKSKRQLITVGRLEVIKGHNYLLRAFRLVCKEFPDAKLLILGEGGEQSNLEEQVLALGLDNNVELMGFQKDPYSFISNSDIAVLPSVYEPFGLVFIEAFALGTPVIAFDAPAGNEIMKNGETALLVPLFDFEALARQISFLLNSPDKGKQLAQNALISYEKNYTVECMVEKTADWYDKTLKLS